MEETRFADLMFVLDRKRRRLADGAACAQCRERNPLSLIDARTPTMCRECDLRRRGLEPFEEHHLGGRPGERTILVPANPHAVTHPAWGFRRDSMNIPLNLRASASDRRKHWRPAPVASAAMTRPPGAQQSRQAARASQIRADSFLRLALAPNPRCRSVRPVRVTDPGGTQ